MPARSKQGGGGGTWRQMAARTAGMAGAVLGGERSRHVGEAWKPEEMAPFQAQIVAHWLDTAAPWGPGQSLKQMWSPRRAWAWLALEPWEAVGGDRGDQPHVGLTAGATRDPRVQGGAEPTQPATTAVATFTAREPEAWGAPLASRPQATCKLRTGILLCVRVGRYWELNQGTPPLRDTSSPFKTVFVETASLRCPSCCTL